MDPQGLPRQQVLLELQAGFVPGRWRCLIRTPSLLRSAAFWLISWAVPLGEVVKGAGALAFKADTTSGYRWPVVGLSRFPPERLLKPIIRFGIEAFGNRWSRSSAYGSSPSLSAAVRLFRGQRGDR